MTYGLRILDANSKMWEPALKLQSYLLIPIFVPHVFDCCYPCYVHLQSIWSVFVRFLHHTRVVSFAHSMILLFLVLPFECAGIAYQERSFRQTLSITGDSSHTLDALQVWRQLCPWPDKLNDTRKSSEHLKLFYTKLNCPSSFGITSCPPSKLDTAVDLYQAIPSKFAENKPHIVQMLTPHRITGDSLSLEDEAFTLTTQLGREVFMLDYKVRKVFLSSDLLPTYNLASWIARQILIAHCRSAA